MEKAAFNSVIAQTPVYFAVFQVKTVPGFAYDDMKNNAIVVYQPEAECFAFVTQKSTRLIKLSAGSVRFYGYLTPEEANKLSKEQNG